MQKQGDVPKGHTIKIKGVKQQSKVEIVVAVNKLLNTQKSTDPLTEGIKPDWFLAQSASDSKQGKSRPDDGGYAFVNFLSDAAVKNAIYQINQYGGRGLFPGITVVASVKKSGDGTSQAVTPSSASAASSQRPSVAASPESSVAPTPKASYSRGGMFTPPMPAVQTDDEPQDLPVQDAAKLDAPPDCVVMLFGVAVSGAPGLAALKLELEYSFRVKALQIAAGRRQVTFSVTSSTEARAAVRFLNGQEVLGHRVTAFLSTATTSILGSVPQSAPTPARSHAQEFGGDAGIKADHDVWKRLVDEAQYVHNQEIQLVQCQINDLPLMYRSCLRACALTPRYWVDGVLQNSNISVHVALQPELRTLAFGQPVTLEGDGIENIVDVYEHVSRSPAGVKLRWISGRADPPERFLLLSDVGYLQSGISEHGPWTRAIKAGSEGRFVAPTLDEWHSSSSQQSAPTTYQKLTWRWWAHGPDVSSVREVFELVSKSQQQGGMTVVLRDLGCSNQLQLNASGLYLRENDRSAWRLIAQGSWSNADQSQWDSELGEEYEAHFETRIEWNQCKWWVDGTGNFSGVRQIHQELPQQSKVAFQVNLISGMNAVTNLTLDQALCSGVRVEGGWVQPPLSVWIPSSCTEEEDEARTPLEALHKQLLAQETEFHQTREKLCDELSRARQPAVARSLQSQLSRELSRFQARLPAYANRQSLLEAVCRHQVTILIGATGSGKSTQTLPFLVDSGVLRRLSGGKGNVACTQPRKVAAVSLANYVASEWGEAVGQAVGFKAGGESKIKKETQMIYLTDRSLLNEILHDSLLSKYDCVVVDEAHERSINADLLFAFLKDVCRARPNFRLIISSATIEPCLFMKYFHITDETAVIRIPGRTFPVEHEWMERPKDMTKKYVDHAVRKTKEVLNLTKGDILTFLPTPDDVKEAAKMLQTLCGEDESLVVMQLHARLDSEAQLDVFRPTPKGKRKIVFSTNVAETSVTIDGITAVIDTGLAKNAEFDAARNMNTLTVGWITKSSVWQRAGRAGRTRPGVAFHMYDEEDLSKMPTSNVAEILRTELLSAILRLKELGISRPADFDFIEHPGRERVLKAESALMALGLIDASGMMTEDGNKCCRLDMDCRLARMLFTAASLGCLHHALRVAGILSAPGNLFFRKEDAGKPPHDKPQQNPFFHPSGDILTNLQAYLAWKDTPYKERKQWCASVLLVPKTLQAADDFVRSTEKAMESSKDVFSKELTSWKTNKDVGVLPDQINRSFVAGFFDNICVANGPAKAGMLLLRDVPDALQGPMGGDIDAEGDGAEADNWSNDSSELCAICLSHLNDGGQKDTVSCGHMFHSACIGPWLIKSSRCPLCRQPLADAKQQSQQQPSSTAGASQTKRPSAYIHPSSCLFKSAITTTPKWIAFQTSAQTTRQFLRTIAAVDPTWPEVAAVVDLAVVSQEAKCESDKIQIPRSILGSFVGTGRRAMLHLESLLDVVIGLPDASETHEVLEMEVFAAPANLPIAVRAIEMRIRMLVDEAEVRQRAWEERQEQRRLEREERHRQYLQRKAEQAERFRQYQERVAAREERHREYLARQAERANRSSSRPYCGTPGRKPPR